MLIFFKVVHPSLRSFVFSVLYISFFYVLSGYFYSFAQFRDSSYFLNFNVLKLSFKIVPYWWTTLVLNSLLLFLFSPILLREFLCNFLLFQSLFPRLTKLYNNQVHKIDDKVFDHWILILPAPRGFQNLIFNQFLFAWESTSN